MLDLALFSTLYTYFTSLQYCYYRYVISSLTFWRQARENLHSLIMLAHSMHMQHTHYTVHEINSPSRSCPFANVQMEAVSSSSLTPNRATGCILKKELLCILTTLTEKVVYLNTSQHISAYLKESIHADMLHVAGC